MTSKQATLAEVNRLRDDFERALAAAETLQKSNSSGGDLFDAKIDALQKALCFLSAENDFLKAMPMPGGPARCDFGQFAKRAAETETAVESALEKLPPDQLLDLAIRTAQRRGIGNQQVPATP